MRTLLEFARDQSGATAIEYGLIVAALCVGIIAALQALGAQIISSFGLLESFLASAGK